MRTLHKGLVSIIAMLFVVFSIPAFAETEATFGNQNSSGVYRLSVDSSGIFTFASDAAIKWPYEQETTNDTLTSADCGRVFVVNPSSTEPTFVLPAAAAGCSFTFVAGTNQTTWWVDPNDADTIQAGTAAPFSAGDRLKFTKVTGVSGDTARFFAIGTGSWYVTKTGSGWSDGN